ncbi:hypothetical protein C8J57DRAFT_1221441 [Mycena rebaudengoi]|nr:hypothetical protein C8J57DRAFT_1221441 [Mycena rebaudengoi]
MFGFSRIQLEFPWLRGAATCISCNSGKLQLWQSQATPLVFIIFYPCRGLDETILMVGSTEWSLHHRVLVVGHQTVGNTPTGIRITPNPYIETHEGSAYCLDDTIFHVVRTLSPFNTGPGCFLHSHLSFAAAMPRKCVAVPHRISRAAPPPRCHGIAHHSNDLRGAYHYLGQKLCEFGFNLANLCTALLLTELRYSKQFVAPLSKIYGANGLLPDLYNSSDGSGDERVEVGLAMTPEARTKARPLSPLITPPRFNFVYNTHAEEKPDLSQDGPNATPTSDEPADSGAISDDETLTRIAKNLREREMDMPKMVSLCRENRTARVFLIPRPAHNANVVLTTSRHRPLPLLPRLALSLVQRIQGLVLVANRALAHPHLRQRLPRTPQGRNTLPTSPRVETLLKKSSKNSHTPSTIPNSCGTLFLAVPRIGAYGTRSLWFITRIKMSTYRMNGERSVR